MIDNKDNFVQSLHGADKKYSLIYKHCKIMIPKQVVEWYHNALCHPGETLTARRISQYFYQKNLCKTSPEIYTNYKMCQFLKRNKKQYGKIPSKEAETIPWDNLFVDLIGQFQFTPKG